MMLIVFLSLSSCTFGIKPSEAEQYLIEKYGGEWTAFHEPVTSLRNYSTTYFFETENDGIIKQVRTVYQRGKFTDDYDDCDVKKALHDTLVWGMSLKAMQSFCDVREMSSVFPSGNNWYSADIMIKEPSFKVSEPSLRMCLLQSAYDVNMEVLIYVLSDKDYEDCQRYYEKTLSLDVWTINRYKYLQTFKATYQNKMWTISDVR